MVSYPETSNDPQLPVKVIIRYFDVVYTYRFVGPILQRKHMENTKIGPTNRFFRCIL